MCAKEWYYNTKREQNTFSFFSNIKFWLLLKIFFYIICCLGYNINIGIRIIRRTTILCYPHSIWYPVVVPSLHWVEPGLIRHITQTSPTTKSETNNINKLRFNQSHYKKTYTALKFFRSYEGWDEREAI